MHTKTKSKPRITEVMNLLKVWGALRRPKGIRRNSNKPKGMVIPVFGTSSEATGIWSLVLTRSCVENAVCRKTDRIQIGRLVVCVDKQGREGKGRLVLTLGIGWRVGRSGARK